VVLCLGLDPSIEGEEGDASNEYAAGDKKNLDLPPIQQALLEAVATAVPGKPLVLVSFTGSAMAYAWADEHLSAIVQAWYPGALGGQAIGEMLFGDFSPSGKLPVTFYRSTADLPEFTDYAMKNRTYRYFKGESLYPFGFGLSYTRFSYSGLTLSSRSIDAGQELRVSATVANTGNRPGSETVQLYLSVPGAGTDYPIRELRGVAKVELAAGKKRTVDFVLNPRDLSSITEEGKRIVRGGQYRVSVGGHQGDAKSEALSGSPAVRADFDVRGEKELQY